MTRLFVGCLACETNSFSPLPTGMGAFETAGIRRAGDRAANPSGVALMLDTIRSAAERDGVEMVEGLVAVAQPGGPIVQAAYETLRDELLRELRAATPDFVVLILHGAMLAEHCNDCEGEILANARAVVGGKIPIGVVFDPHCHLTAKMVAQADILICFKEYPHTDTAARAADGYRLTRDTLLGRIVPVTAVQDCRMVGLWPTTDQQVRLIVDRMAELETSPGVLSLSFGHGFPWGDTAEAGAKVWCISDGDVDLAEATAAALAETVWQHREAARPLLISVDTLVARLRAPRTRTILVADMADNPGGGAPGDSSFLLSALLAGSIGDVAIGCLWDPHAVMVAHDAGVGAKLTLRIGGKTGATSGLPVDVAVTVRTLCDNHGQVGFGMRLPFGRAAWVATDTGIDIVLVSVRQQVLGPSAFEALGVSLAERAAVIVKSAQHFQAGFADFDAEIVRVDTPGALRHDFGSLPYRHRSLTYWPRLADPFANMRV